MEILPLCLYPSLPCSPPLFVIKACKNVWMWLSALALIKIYDKDYLWVSLFNSLFLNWKWIVGHKLSLYKSKQHIKHKELFKSQLVFYSGSCVPLSIWIWLVYFLFICSLWTNIYDYLFYQYFKGLVILISPGFAVILPVNKLAWRC